MRGSMLADAAHELGLVPFVNQHDVRAVQCRVKIELVEFVAMRVEKRKGALEIVDRFLPMLGEEILIAPRIARLVDVDAVTALEQLRGDAAQEVRVAMIPIGN